MTFLFNGELLSQKLNDNLTDPNIQNFSEELFVRTDRDTYITGEDVWLKVYKLSGFTQIPVNLSKVVYLELLDKNNISVKQVKISVENISGSASFPLPENISSGNYMIRAYTNWMKNFTPDHFFYKAISVINPFESIDHIKLPVKAKSLSSSGVNDDILNAAIIDENGSRVNSVPAGIENKQQIIFKITLDKKGYLSRDKVRMEISASDQNGNPVDADLSVSVVKSVLNSSDRLPGFYSFNNNDSIAGRLHNSGNIAELEGQLISGYLRLKNTDEPLRKTELSLSFVGKVARCQFGKTNENGEFNFLVKESGLNEIVIQPLSPDITGYYVELKQPFSSSFSKWKPSELYLDSSRINDINKVIISSQIKNIYEPFRAIKSASAKKTVPDFYGKPERTILLSDFIELTTLREVVKEIIPNVYTQKQGGKYDFKLINKYQGQPFENKPLILIDGVPVYDYEKILNINSKEIERANVLNTRYFFSDYIFDGIVSFITKKGNLSVLEFDNSVFRQVFEGCQAKTKFYSPDYSDPVLKNNRIPDFRNTLFWEPDLHTGKEGRTNCDFFTSDESSRFTIIVEGITSGGLKGNSSAVLIVN